MKIVFQATVGSAPTNIRFEQDGYALQTNEHVLSGSTIPSPSSYLTYDGSTITINTAQQTTDAAKQATILSDLATNLPAWTTIAAAINAISTMADAKAFLLKLTKVCYQHIKNDTV